MTYVGYSEPFPASTRGNRWGIKGPFYGPAGHRGQDWAPGDKVALAVADGTVVKNEYGAILGNVVVLRHDDGMYSGYAHLAKRSTLKIGARVKRGGSLGARLGATGSAAAGRHCHMTIGKSAESIYSGVTYDPLKWIADHPVKTAKPAKRKSTKARKGEGLAAIAARSGISLARIKALNTQVKAPHYIVQLGQTIYLS